MLAGPKYTNAPLVFSSRERSRLSSMIRRSFPRPRGHSGFGKACQVAGSPACLSSFPLWSCPQTLLTSEYLRQVGWVFFFLSFSFLSLSLFQFSHNGCCFPPSFSIVFSPISYEKGQNNSTLLNLSSRPWFQAVHSPSSTEHFPPSNWTQEHRKARQETLKWFWNDYSGGCSQPNVNNSP